MYKQDGNFFFLILIFASCTYAQTQTHTHILKSFEIIIFSYVQKFELSDLGESHGGVKGVVKENQSAQVKISVGKKNYHLTVSLFLHFIVIISLSSLFLLSYFSLTFFCLSFSLSTWVCLYFISVYTYVHKFLSDSYLL